MADIYIGNVKGPQGETGATGAQGPQGDAATIEVGTVSTTAYGNTAQVINTGTSSEAVFDFVIPQGRPGEETTTMSSLTLDTVTAQSAEYPIPATGESGAVVFGKIIKFFNDIKTAVNSKINISDIVNNLTSTATNKPLSAAQGKALNDALATTNTAVAQLRTLKRCEILMANPQVITRTAGDAFCYYFNNNYVIVFATLAFRSTVQRAAGTSVFRLSIDGKDITVNEPYNLPCIMSTDNVMKFAGYSADDNRFFAVPSAWPANTDVRYSGVFSASLSS